MGKGEGKGEEDMNETTTTPTTQAVKDKALSYGTVYKIMNDTAGKYTGRSVLQLTNIVDALKQEGNNAYKADKHFPLKFYEVMSGLLIKWFWNGFEGATKECILELFKEMWRYHRAFLTKETMADEDWKKFVDQGKNLGLRYYDADGKDVGNKPKYVRFFYDAIMHDMDETHTA